MIKLFSHGADPDGLGCVVLASLAYLSLDVTLCKDPNDLNETLEAFLDNHENECYDKIYITDLCPADKYVSLLEAQATPVMIFDHHLTSKKQLSKDYSFVVSMEEENGSLVCATSLFYKYLLEQNLIESDAYVETFVEYTRLHDTYDWKRVGNTLAYELQTIFQFLGWNGYIRHFHDRCVSSKEFSYDKEEQEWINLQRKRNKMALERLLKHLVVTKYGDITYGSVIGEYEYRNLLADEVGRLYPDVDIVMLLAYNNESVSFRSLKDVPVEPLAREYGGGGHMRAAQCKLTSENEQKLLRKFIVK